MSGAPNPNRASLRGPPLAFAVSACVRAHVCPNSSRWSLATHQLCFAALWSISAPADGWILINAFWAEGMSILKMIHNGFEDLKISLDLEAFRNLPQLQAETETFPSQSTIHFSLYSLLYFWISFSLFCPQVFPWADQINGLHTTLLSSVLVCDPNLMTRGTSKHLTCESISAVEGFSWGENRTCHIESSSTGNWVTRARKEGTRGCRKHLAANPCLFVL